MLFGREGVSDGMEVPWTQARKETSKTGGGGAPDGTGWLQRELPNTGEAGTDSSVNTCK